MKYLLLLAFLASCATDNRECLQYKRKLGKGPGRGMSRCVKWADKV